MKEGEKPNLHTGRPTLNYIDLQICEKYGQKTLEFFAGEISYQLQFKSPQPKSFIDKIKALLSLDFEIVPINGWNSEKGQAMKILMRSYHQLNAEEENRVHKEMEKNTKKR